MEPAETHCRCELRTWREGVLSRVGHDLLLDVGPAALRREGDVVTASVQASSVRVRCAMRDGREDPAALSPKDRAQIDAAARDEVLDAARHPRITLRAALPAGLAPPTTLTAALTLRGVTRDVRVALSTEGGATVAVITVRPSEFGVKPFTAMLGALRVRDAVEIRVTVPWTA
jgi:polyisoprenoid-binding protein YceI